MAIVLTKSNSPYNSKKEKIKNIAKGMGIKVVIGSSIICISLPFLVSLKKDALKEFVKSDSVTTEEAPLIEFNAIPLFENKVKADAMTLDAEVIEQAAIEEVDSLLQIRQDTIKHYCAIYSVSYEQVYAKIVLLTDNFSNENFVHYLTIDGVKCKSNQPYADNEEELFIYAVRAMAQTPSVFGFDESLYVESTFISSVDYAAMIDYYAKIFQVDRRLAYAIIASETSFNSNHFLNNNNPAGIRLNDEFVIYDNLDRGMIEFYTELLKYHFKFGANTLEEIRDIHSPLTDGNIYWLPNVTSIYNDLVCGVKEPFSNEAYSLWRHNGEEVYSVFVEGEQDSFFGDRELYQDQMRLK